MKKIILAVLLSVTSFATLAYDYCSTRPNQFDRNTCYRANVDVSNSQVTHTYNQAMASPKLSREHKANLRQKVSAFYDRMNAGCPDDRCVVNSLNDQRQWILNYYNRYATK